MERDYEIGEFIKDEIIPKAVQWFTGEASAAYDEEDDGDDEDEDEDGEDGSDGDESEDDD